MKTYTLESILNEKYPDDIDTYKPMNADSLEKHIHLLPSKSICDLLLTIKMFGMGKELEVICMKKLVQNRIQGDDFNYEEYVKNNTAEKVKTIKHNFDTYRSLIKDAKRPNK